MAISEEEITRLYRIRRTVMQMLRDRGYLVTESEINMTKEQFKSTYKENMEREDLDINKEKRSKNSDQIYVFFPNEAKVGMTTMREYTKGMQWQNVFRAILVSQTKLTPFAIRCISEMSSKFHMEVFQEFTEWKKLDGHFLLHVVGGACFATICVFWQFDSYLSFVS